MPPKPLDRFPNSPNMSATGSREEFKVPLNTPMLVLIAAMAEADSVEIFSSMLLQSVKDWLSIFHNKSNDRGKRSISRFSGVHYVYSLVWSLAFLSV